MIINPKNFAIALLFICTLGHGQKIKYKELFIMLSAKQYGQAEPFLRKYLKENQDNPNAFLNMGFIMEEKALANDVLKETSKALTNIDTAILFFDKAYKTIDEREVKKNDEYYQSFSRRDLRTGEFGLKLSDIQFELEKRIKALRERHAKIKDAQAKFLALQLIYNRSTTLFKSIATGYKDQREFFLRADNQLSSNLGKLERRYDSCLIIFNDYKTALQSLGKTGYNHEWSPRDITDFKIDGTSSIDFLQDELNVWDFKRWAASNLDVIEKEIKPMADKLTHIDTELNALREKIKKDSVSVTNELASITAKIKAVGLEKFDPKPFPADVFAVKISELRFGSELATTRKLRDSADVVLSLGLLKKQTRLLSDIDSTGALALSRDLEYESQNYKGYVSMAYGSVADLKNTIKSTMDFAIAEKAAKEKRIKNLAVLANWIIDQSDSIPANSTVRSNRFTPMAIVSNSYTFGFSYRDSSSFAYFYQLTPSHRPAAKATFQVDSVSFKKEKFPLLKGMVAVEASGKSFYITLYSEEFVSGKVLALIYKVGPEGLLWKSYLRLEGMPLETTIAPQGELNIKIGTSSGNKLVVIQPDGKPQG